MLTSLCLSRRVRHNRFTLLHKKLNLTKSGSHSSFLLCICTFRSARCSSVFACNCTLQISRTCFLRIFRKAHLCKQTELDSLAPTFKEERLQVAREPIAKMLCHSAYHLLFFLQKVVVVGNMKTQQNTRIVFTSCSLAVIEAYSLLPTPRGQHTCTKTVVDLKSF